MGKLRYIVIFGVLGNGFAPGLGMGMALMTSRHHYDWGLETTIFGAVALVTGLYPHYLPSNDWKELSVESRPAEEFTAVALVIAEDIRRLAQQGDLTSAAIRGAQMLAEAPVSYRPATLGRRRR